MGGLIAFLIFLCLIYGGISWILPKLLAWLCKRKYKVKVEIGRIGIPYFILHDVCISRNGFSIHIEEIYFRSSFFSSEVTKLVSVIVRDVRINKDISSSISGEDDLVSNKLSFQNKRIPPPILTFVQFMAIHVYNINAMLLRKESPEWLVHATAAELHLDGSIIHNARTLLVNASLVSTTAKLLKHAVENNPQTCLAELSFGISLEGTVIAHGTMSVEKLYVEIDKVKSVINEGIYKFAQRNRVQKIVVKEKEIYCESSDNLFLRFFPIIPKNFTLKIGNSILNGMGEDNRLDFSSTLQCLMFNSQVNQLTDLKPVKEPPTRLPQLFLSVVVDNFCIKCNRENLVEMNKLTIDGKYEESVLFVYLALDTICVSYHHQLLQPWIVNNFTRDKTSNGKFDFNKFSKTKRGKSWFENFCSSCQVSGRMELRRVSAWLNLPGEPTLTSIGFTRTEILLDRIPDLRGSVYESPLGKLFFADKHWNLEWIVESLWCKISDSLLNADPPMIKKYHTWGTPLFVGIVVAKARSQGVREIKSNVMIDLFRTEWSPVTSQLILQCLRCVSEYGVNYLVPRKLSKSLKSKNDVIFTSSIVCQNINLFFIVNKKICLISRCDKLNLDSVKGKLELVVEGTKMSSLTPNAIQYSCVKSEEIKLMCAQIKLARISFKTTNKELSCHFQEQVIIKWCANLHLKILTLIAALTKFLQELKCALGVSASDSSAISDSSTEDIEKHEETLKWIFAVKGDVHLYLKVGFDHEITLISSNLTAGNTNTFVGGQSTLLRIVVDGAQIFTFETLCLSQISHNEEVSEERKKNEGLSLNENNIWTVTIESFKAAFPHEHNYADAVQNDFVTIWKWLKLIHKKKKSVSTTESPLPPDLLIKIKDFLFEMSDDSFEIKLRDNYELLEDEYQESLKREQMLDAKVAELSKTHLSMPASKIEELYESLRRKNAEIYIQRSKQISKQSPARTRLLAWSIKDVKIISLADPTIHGAENVVRVMTEVDADSLWPEEGLEFSILWCRYISASCSEWSVQLRDFPQPFMDVKRFHIFGRLCGAEQEATKRSKREVVVEFGEPFGSLAIDRSMTALKFYHDFNCNVQYFSYAFGPCWEPVIAQCSLSFEKILPLSKDPSPPLPYWDKMRLLFHGRLTMFVHQLTMLLHASLDPYNTTEEMELKWTKVAMDWTNAKVIFQGDFDVNVKTASKYDDRRLLHLPNVKLTLKMHWVCLADPNDHHAVMPCAPDKLPEYSSNQEHDSFRAFRSQNVNVNLSLETKPLTNSKNAEFDCPNASLFGSTLRWCENLKLILSGVTRPTKRGAVFRNIRPRKKQLSRHYRKVRILLGFHKFQIYYWMSFAKQIGFELLGGRITFNSEHVLNIIQVDDSLKHRPRAEWSVMCMNCDLNDVEIWLKSALQGPGNEVLSLTQPVEKCYCLSVAKVSYVRETVLHRRTTDILNTSDRGVSSKDIPTHRLVVYDLKGAWTKKNRDIAFTLFDAFMKSKQLKKNLSTESLKQFRNDCANKSRASKLNDSLTSTAMTATSPSPMTKTPSGNAALMLQQLIAEVGNKPEAYSDDLSSQSMGQQLQGLQACQEDDVVHKNWLIALVNSQVLLKGCDTKGYVILSAAKAEILQRIHNPVWKDGALVSKTTWVGSLECMQYYATVAARESDKIDENIMWVTVDNIQEKDSSAAVIEDLPDVPHLVGSGQSVGGIVTETVGASSIDEGKSNPVQLQRIVSRCKCEFFYARHGDTSIDPNTLEEVPPILIEENSPWEKKETAVDAFTLMHHDLNVCTNSLQYAMILDIVNHLLLYVDPKRKELYERLQRMRFQLALHTTEDQRAPIQALQNQVRSLVSKLKRLEKETYLLQKQLAEDHSKELIMEIKNLNQEVFECKELLTTQSEELDMMLSCYKESQLSANQRLSTTKGDAPVKTVRANEIVFKYAKWRLTEADGQLGIADLVLTNFLYTKNSKSDDSVEHLLELDYVRMTNLLPNQIYTEVLTPSEMQSSMPIDRKRSVRVYCREKAPVGGISVKEHFEINVAPLTIGLTKKFYNTMVAFCFPGRDPDTIEGENLDEMDDQQQKGSKRNKSSFKKGKETNFYVKIDDDVEKMKERAEKNKLFIYIKIPEVPVRVSYKGSKEKNLEDTRDLSLVIPTLEYHNVTWTWLDLLLAMKTDSRRVILSQAIKQKLQIKSNKGNKEEGSPQEEDKVRMLFGNRVVPTAKEKSLRKSIFKQRKL